MDGAHKRSQGLAKKSPTVQFLQHMTRMVALAAFILLQGWAPQRKSSRAFGIVYEPVVQTL